MAALAMSVVLSLPTAGCVTGAGGSSALDGVIARCAVSVLGGAVIGGLIGAASNGGRGAAIGAGAGAAVGGVACAVYAALDAQDRARIRQAQIQAAASNQTRYVSYPGSDGRSRQITVRPRPVETPQSVGRVCRRVDGTATVGGTGTATLPEQIVCRNPNGDWV